MKLQYCILAILAFAVVNGHPRGCQDDHLREAIICEGVEGSFKCPEGKKIKVVSANYGRTERAVCPDTRILTLTCLLASSVVNVRRDCDDKESCELTPSNAFFGWTLVRTPTNTFR